MRSCGCPDRSGHYIADPERHAAWHALVVEQGGPVGKVNGETLRVTRGMQNAAPAHYTLFDTRRRTGRRT